MSNHPMHYRQYLAISVGCLVGFCNGMTLPTIPSSKDDCAQKITQKRNPWILMTDVFFYYNTQEVHALVAKKKWNILFI